MIIQISYRERERHCVDNFQDEMEGQKLLPDVSLWAEKKIFQESSTSRWLVGHWN